MQKLISTFILSLLLCGICHAQTLSEYEGNVGSKTVVFTLEWNEKSKQVSGHYFTIDRPNFQYELTGRNDKAGQLVLKERTNGKVTATIRLSKSIRDGHVHWSGTMYNTDGRRIPVALTRGCSC